MIRAPHPPTRAWPWLLLLPIFGFAGAPAAADPSPAPGYLEAPATAAYDVDSTGCTVEFWIRVASKPSFDPRIVSLVNDAPGPCYQETTAQIDILICNLSECSPGTIIFVIAANGSCVVASSSRRVDDGRYHHVACVYDGARMWVSVDGAREGEVSAPERRARLHPGRLVVGNSQDLTSRLDGSIDELRLWKAARSDDELRTHMNQEIDPESPGLAGYWRFNGNGADETGGNPLTPRNTVTFREGKLGEAAELVNVDPLRGEAGPWLAPPARGHEAAPEEGVGALAPGAPFLQGTEAGLADGLHGVLALLEAGGVQPSHPRARRLVVHRP